MINLFNFLYKKCHNNIPILERTKINSVMRYIIYNIANKTLPIYFRKIKNKYKQSRVDNMIVTLTTFPQRIDTVWLAIESIMRQTFLPKKILLWLSLEQFPNGLDDLPISLLKYLDQGLEIKFVEEDYKSHKKYLYVFTKYPKYLVITVDDDIFYPTRMIENLYKSHLNYPASVICRYCYKKQYNMRGVLQPYCTWVKSITPQGPTNQLFFGTGGGTLFPPESLHEDYNNISLIMQLAPKADDVWLNAMCLLNNTSICQAENGSSILTIKNKSSNLSSENLGNNLNDVQIQNIQQYYKLEL